MFLIKLISHTKLFPLFLNQFQQFTYRRSDLSKFLAVIEETSPIVFPWNRQSDFRHQFVTVVGSRIY